MSCIPQPSTRKFFLEKPTAAEYFRTIQTGGGKQSLTAAFSSSTAVMFNITERNISMKQLFKILLVFVCVVAFTACGTNTLSDSFAQTAASGENSTAPLPQSALALKTAKENNPDTVAWLRVPGTEIDHPVLQSTDNDYYLRRDENGKDSVWGCYFADYYSTLSDPSKLQQNTVIYGHSQSDEDVDGERFTQLFHYLDMDFLKENPYIYLTVGEKELIFQIGAVLFTDIDFYYINPTPSEEGFADFADTITAKNEYIFDSGKLTEQDKLLTLSACAYRYDTAKTGDQRLVVVARLVEDEANTFGVTANHDPQRP